MSVNKEGDRAVEEAAMVPADPAEGQIPAASKKKKKSKGRSKAARGPTALSKNCGTGFEEFFADPPMTTQEAEEEKTCIYAPEIPFEERIQSCIQRFRGRRRLLGEKIRYFDEYLFLGGIDTTPAAFGGYDPKELKALTPAERRDVTAFDTVHMGSSADEKFFDGDFENWTVDFVGVVAGFFSVTMRKFTLFEDAKAKEAIDVVEKFLLYILQHDVCPEYANDVRAALQICNTAREECPKIKSLTQLLPGTFNMAAAELESGGDRECWRQAWMTRPEGFTPLVHVCCVLTFLGNSAAAASVEKTDNADKEAQDVECTLQLVRIEQADNSISIKLASVVVGSDTHRIAPTGKAYFRMCEPLEDGWHSPLSSRHTNEEVMLYFEEHVLNMMPLGLKMNATLGKIGDGVTFLKKFQEVVPSFYTFLPQELMRHYKTPRRSERPGPSIHNSEFEDENDDDDYPQIRDENIQTQQEGQD